MAYDKVVDSAVLDAALAGIANAIRGKTGGTGKLTLEEMPAAIAGIQAGCDGNAMDAFLDGTLEHLTSNARYIYGESFYGYLPIKTVNFPNLIRSGKSAFYGCTNLESASMPLLMSVDSNLFRGCSALTDVSVPSLETAGYYCFSGIAATVIDFPKLKTMASSLCENSKNLKTLILRNTSVCKMDRIDALAGTPFAANGSGGVVYIPQALIPQYQQATNWSALYEGGTCEFRAIEGSEYE